MAIDRGTRIFRSIAVVVVALGVANFIAVVIEVFFS